MQYELKAFDDIIAIAERELITEPTGHSIDKDFLYRYMTLSLIQTKDASILDTVETWLVERPFSRQHALFFESDEFNTFKTTQDLNEELLRKIFIKKLVHEGDYKGASEDIFDALNERDEALFFTHLDEYYLSDIGKALLYGSEDTLMYAEILETAASEYASKSPEAFMCYFYAGRLYEKNKSFMYIAADMFNNAVNAAANEKHYDNALWYYLSAIRKISTRNCIDELLVYAPLWHDPYYYDDLLNTLAYQLLEVKNYKGFYALFNAIKESMSPESVSKYAYMSGLFIAQGYLDAEFTSDAEKQEEIIALYEESLHATNGTLYYRIMAAYELGLKTEDALVAFSTFEGSTKIKADEKFESLLMEYMRCGLLDEVYTLFMEDYELVSLDCSIQLAEQLRKENNPSLENDYAKNYYPEALRIVSKTIHSVQDVLPRDTMKLLYPKHYAGHVNQAVSTFELKEAVLYGLIRSESYFDHDIESWAGAIGLTQLMPLTANDIARKLKVDDYDLHSARQNIDFGAFYLDELLPRFGVDNSVLRALFAYNAGITNVRRWGNAYPELLDNMPLFLESIPFAETREYGRKALSATVMYALLYEDVEFSTAVELIMN